MVSSRPELLELCQKSKIGVVQRQILGEHHLVHLVHMTLLNANLQFSQTVKKSLGTLNLLQVFAPYLT